MPLIRYLVWEGWRYRWKICVASMLDHDPTPIKDEKYSNDIIFISITNFRQCDHAIRKADLILAMLPDAMLIPVTERCIMHGRSLITPSAINPLNINRKFRPEESGSLILSECGFSPGLDHVTAKKAIDTIQKKGGKILSFKTFSGSLISAASIDNPWEFKLTEPCQSLLNLGKGNNRHLMHGHIQNVPHSQVFSRATPIEVPGLKDTLAFPEGDALVYQKTYGLKDTPTIVKGKIIRSGFEKTWNLIIRLGLTDPGFSVKMNSHASFYNFLDSLLPYSENETPECRLMKYMNANTHDIEKLKCLGLFKKEWVNGKSLNSAAAILQHLMEENFSMRREDKDNVVMQHELEYNFRNVGYRFKATLVAEGEAYPDDSAMAKAVGLTTGAAAKAFLLGNIKMKGFRLPVTQDIYDPILQELTDLGVDFHFNEKKICTGGHDINFNLNLN